jgi:hypothetical protein
LPNHAFESFKAAFAFICSLTKTAAPVTKYAASWWVDSAQQWCRDSGVEGVIRSLFPAINACGDVQYSLDDRSAFWLDSYPRFRSRCGRTGLAQYPQRQRST